MTKKLSGPGGWGHVAWLAASILLLLMACTQEKADWSGPADPIVEPAGVLGEIRATPLTIPTAGETSLIEVEVFNLQGEPAAGVEVSFSAELGSITPTAASDESGLARAVFTAGSVSGLAEIVASIPGAQKALLVLVGEGTLTTEPSSILANGVDSCLVSGRIPAELGGSPAGTRVRFTTTEGTLSAVEAVADPTGIVSVWLRSEVSSRDLGATMTMINADDPDLVYGVAVVIFRGMELEISAQDTLLQADGMGQTTVEARLRETTSRVAIPGVPVVFATDHGTISISDTTDATGKATAVFTTAAYPEIALVTATVLGRVTDNVSIHMVSGEPADILLSTDRLSIGVSGVGEVESSTIFATVLDGGGNPVSDGTQVTFEIILGPGGGEHLDSLAIGYGPVVRTTREGIARVSLKSGTVSGVVNVQATAAEVVTSGAQVVIESGPPAEIILTVGGDIFSVEGACMWQRLAGALVTDRYTNPVEDSTAVYFTLTDGARAMVEGSSSTGISTPYTCGSHPPAVSGVAYTCLTYGSPDVFDSYYLIARTAGGGEIVTDSIAVSNWIAEPTLGISASPAVFDSTTGGVSLISVVLRDAGGCYIKDGLIDFSANHASVDFTQDWQSTDLGGWAATQAIVPPMGPTTIEVTARLRGTALVATTNIELK